MENNMDEAGHNMLVGFSETDARDARCDAQAAAAHAGATLTDEREALKRAYNCGWDASDACDNAYNNGTSEQLAEPPQSHEPEQFQKWRAEWFSNRDEAISALFAAPTPVADSGAITNAEVANAAPATAEHAGATLTVWYGSMPETNGKSNFTAILHRGDISAGHTIDRSEYPDRVRYEADRVRWLIGEIDKEPWILDYDADKHSGYVAPTPVAAKGATLTGEQIEAIWNAVDSSDISFNDRELSAKLRRRFARALLAAADATRLQPGRQSIDRTDPSHRIDRRAEVSESRLADCLANIKGWEDEARAEMDAMYPAGCVIGFRLSSKQTNPTYAEVLEAPWERAGCVRVRLLNAKKNSRRPCRTVRYTEIMVVDRTKTGSTGEPK